MVFPGAAGINCVETFILYFEEEVLSAIILWFLLRKQKPTLFLEQFFCGIKDIKYTREEKSQPATATSEQQCYFTSVVRLHGAKVTTVSTRPTGPTGTAMTVMTVMFQVFLHLWIMAHTVVRWSPKALEMAL